MKINDIILLENIRYYSEEMIIKDINLQEKTQFIKNIYPLIDVFINDAFSVSHRSHVSITGFCRMTPSYAGLLMKKEIENIQKIMNKNGQYVFCLGGLKIDDTIDIITKLLLKNNNYIFLLGGLPGNIALEASDYNIGEINRKNILDSKYYKYINTMKNLLKKYNKNIYYPIDVALNDHGSRKEVSINEIKSFKLKIEDIGSETIKQFKNVIKNSDVSILNGPLGVIEKNGFNIGTKSIINATSYSKYSLIGGGDISKELLKTSKSKHFSYVSNAGKACLYYLSENDLPGLKSLEYYYNKLNK